MIKCSYLFLNKVFAMERSKFDENSKMNLPSAFTSHKSYPHARFQNLFIISLHVHLDHS